MFAKRTWHLVATWLPFMQAEVLRVMVIHNSAETSAGFQEGFDFFLSRMRERMGGVYELNDSLCEEDLRRNPVADVQRCVTRANAEDVDALIVATSVYNDEVKAAAEQHSIPNIHCSGGNPQSWTSSSPHAFGLHLPFVSYTRGPLQQAFLLNLSSVLILRDYDWAFTRRSAVASTEWSRMSNLRLVGPSLKWCIQWSAKTHTCSQRNYRCVCGFQTEFDEMGYQHNLANAPSFYEVSESKILEDGFDPRSDGVSPALVAFVEGIIEDVREQGLSPDIVVNWLSSARSALAAMKSTRLQYKMFIGHPSEGGRSWTGYESTWPNGSRALGYEEALHNVGIGQWHADLYFSDPILASSAEAVSRYHQTYGAKPTYDAAACMAAGTTLVHSLEKSGRSLEGKSMAQRREEIRLSIGHFNDETVFGRVSFNRNNQNMGRSTVSWQVGAEGSTGTVLPVEMAAQRFLFPSPSWEARLGCPAGNYVSEVQCLPCQEGSFRSTPSPPLASTQCERCPAGRGTDKGVTGLVECPLCSAGRFPDASGICQECPLGRFRSANSTEGCLPCAAGEFANATGLAACMPCPLHSSQPEVGQPNCVCNVGFYKDPIDIAVWGNSLPCLECYEQLPGSTTQYPNARSFDECICPVGRFKHRVSAGSAVAHCKECPKGLICRGGRNATGAHQAPLQAKGYSAGEPAFDGADPPYVVECTSNVRCPAELPLGACPAKNLGMGCVHCEPEHYDNYGLCESCVDSSFAVWPLLVALICGLVVMAVVYKFATKLDRSSRDAVVTVVISTGVAIATLQSMPAFGKVEVAWVEPLKTLRGVLAFLTFDIDILRPGCWMGQRHAAISYFYAICSYPAGAMMLSIFLGMSSFFLRKRVTCRDVVNANGLIFSAIFIAFTSLCVRPFKCVLNPDGTWSMASDRDVICWQDGRHQLIVALSLLPSLAGVVPFISLVLWAVTQYSRRVTRPGGVKFVKQWNFIFARFNPSAYYFIVVLGLRDLVIGLLPAWMPANMEISFMVLTVVLSSYGLLQARIWPWKTRMGNLLDSGCTLLLMTVVILGCMLLDFDVAKGTVVIQIISMIGFVMASLGLLCITALVAYRTYNPTKTYGIFLSHHKMGAATLCRWLKLMLSNVIQDRIFLDSDDVSKLDAIMDVTAWDCQNVVVVMTSETLKRMWCAAEIASAWTGESNIVLLSCDGNGITPELIDLVPALWSEEQEATLAASGVSIKNIVDAYTGLLRLRPVELRRHGAKEMEHLNAMRQIVAQCKGLSLFMLTRLQKTNRSNSYGQTGMTSSTLGFEVQTYSVFLTGDLKTPESGSCCRVIQVLLQSSMQEAVQVMDFGKAISHTEHFVDTVTGVKAVLVVLTQGVLHETSFAGCITAIPEEDRHKLVPVKADEGFAYPDARFWEHLAEGKIFSDETLEALDTDVDLIRVGYSQLFNVLAMKFTAHGSAHIQHTEITVITGRILPMLETLDPARERLSALQRLRSVMSSYGDSRSRPESAQASRCGSKNVPEELQLQDDEDDGEEKWIRGVSGASWDMTSLEIQRKLVTEEF